ncbi:tetratricopeptide repeat protein [Roseibium sediminicola]|uniref:Tetratricopeptide repeat protein n=1 Tax=Roseibium sediminicola TaxID=2933272 RepID=A0ABT0GX33_9HYPH|nr:tetratricopeptide repeat protein [Roseibium sp. CAU 1639]MCK7614004.1 tetratricopeptide repeat protein [Roseibium sp. CAU 1639]
MSNLNALLDAATKHIEKGAIDDAEDLCRQALSRAPRNVRALKTHGLCQIGAGDLKAAMKSFELVLQLDPEDATACYNLALAQHAQGLFDLAELNFERALSLDPENATFHEAVAGILALRGQIEDAMRHLLMALELRPEDPSILANIGSVLSQIGALYDAVSHYERALEKQPENGPVTMQLAQILHDLGDHDRGLRLTEELYLKRPRDPVVLAAFAHSLAMVGDLERAAELVGKAFKISPDTVNALEEHALISAYRGDPDSGIAKLAGLLKTQKDNPHFCLLMATGLARVGKHAESVTLAEVALQEPATCAVAATLVRQGLFQQGKFAEAAEIMARLGAQTGGLDGVAAEDPDKVIIPLETKPLEAILFARFLGDRRPAEAAPAGQTIFAHEPLIPLLNRMSHGQEIRSLRGENLFTLAESGKSCFLASYAARPDINRYDPAGFEPYLRSDSRADDFWRGSLAPLRKPLCGITWAKHAPAPLLRDVEAGLQEWPGSVLSLMWDDQRAELEGNRKIIDAGAHLKSIEMLIDLIGKLDLVIGPDGPATHIAGAMGVPAIVLVTPDRQWYWYAPEGRSHWYPSVHVLERPWDEPMDRFAQRLSEKTSELAGLATV